MTKYNTIKKLKADAKLALGINYHSSPGEFIYVGGVMFLEDHIDLDAAVRKTISARESHVNKMIEFAFYKRLADLSKRCGDIGNLYTNKVYSLNDDCSCVIKEMNEERIVVVHYLDGVMQFVDTINVDGSQLLVDVSVENDILDAHGNGGFPHRLSPLRKPTIISLEKSDGTKTPVEYLRKTNSYLQTCILTKETVPSTTTVEVILKALTFQGHNTLIVIDTDVLNRLRETNDEFERVRSLLKYKHCSIIITHSAEDKKLPLFIEGRYALTTRSVADKKMYEILKK